MFLVDGHLGSIYLSDRDAEDIMERCEQCGDSDWVVFDFCPESAYEAIMEYSDSEKDWSSISPQHFANLCLGDELITQEQYDELEARFCWNDEEGTDDE